MRRLGGIKSSGMGSSRLQVLRGILRELKLLSPVKVIKWLLDHEKYNNRDGVLVSDGLVNSKRVHSPKHLVWHLSSCRSRRQDDKDDKGSKPLGKAPLLDLLLSLGVLNNPLDPDFCSVYDFKENIAACSPWVGWWCPPLPIPSIDDWNCSQAPWNTVKTRNQEPIRLKFAS